MPREKLLRQTLIWFACLNERQADRGYILGCGIYRQRSLVRMVPHNFGEQFRIPDSDCV